jgi:hypothetical protein
MKVRFSNSLTTLLLAKICLRKIILNSMMTVVHQISIHIEDANLKVSYHSHINLSIDVPEKRNSKNKSVRKSKDRSILDNKASLEDVIQLNDSL